MAVSSSGTTDYRAPTSPSPDNQWLRNLIVCSVGSFTTIVGMTLILPILPLYVHQLGVRSQSQITLWSGIAYAATFLTAALTAPLWGYLGDRYGRKSMLVRASLGMAVAMSLIGFAQNVTQLVLLRLLVGLLGGYSSGSTILVADQTPKRHSAGALGVLSSAIMAGNIAGPLIGGGIAEVFGVKTAFLGAGALIFLAFLGTVLFLREEPGNHSETTAVSVAPKHGSEWNNVPNKPIIACLLGLSMLLMFATTSVEPIITVHIQELTGGVSRIALLSSITFSLTALGTVLSSTPLGRIADRVGHLRILCASLAAATALLALQAVAPQLWMFAVLRFLMGMALGGITPTVVATIRQLVPKTSVGLVLGSNVSAQYVGQVTGPILAGMIAGLLGTQSVFVLSAAVTAAGLCAALLISHRLAAWNVFDARPQVAAIWKAASSSLALPMPEGELAAGKRNGHSHECHVALHYLICGAIVVIYMILYWKYIIDIFVEVRHGADSNQCSRRYQGACGCCIRQERHNHAKRHENDGHASRE